MYATPFALLLAALFFYFEVAFNFPHVFLLATLFAIFFPLSALLSYTLILPPLQRGEQNVTPRLIELLSRDSKLIYGMRFLLLLPIALIGVLLLPVKESFLFAVVLIGLGLDLLYLHSCRLTTYLNPFRMVDFLVGAGERFISQSRDAELCELIESTTEVAIKSVDRHQSALANRAIDGLEKMGGKFLTQKKNFAHPPQNVELQLQGIKDTLSYVILFLLEHLEEIQERALDEKLSLIASHVVTTFAKLAIYASKIDPSLAALALHFVNKTSLKAAQRGFYDSGIKATVGLLELAKAIAMSKDLLRQDLKSTMIPLIAGLEALAKELFKQNKNTEMQVLTSPFHELARLISQEPFQGHQDAPYLIQQINRILGDFQALEAILKAMPPLPKLNLEEEKTS